MGYVRFAHSTHGWGTTPRGAIRGLYPRSISMGYVHAFGVQFTHGWGTVIATRFAWLYLRVVPWVAPTDKILPPRRGSIVCCYVSVGHVRVAHSTHGWCTAPRWGYSWFAPTINFHGLCARLWRSIHPRLGYSHRYVIRMVVFTGTVGCTHG